MIDRGTLEQDIVSGATAVPATASLGSPPESLKAVSSPDEGVNARMHPRGFRGFRNAERGDMFNHGHGHTVGVCDLARHAGNAGIRGRYGPERGDRVATRARHHRALSDYIDCGSPQMRPAADYYDVDLSVLTQLQAEPSGATRVTTTLTAAAKSPTFSRGFDRCASTSRLETKLSRLLEAELKR